MAKSKGMILTLKNHNFTVTTASHGYFIIKILINNNDKFLRFLNYYLFEKHFYYFMCLKDNYDPKQVWVIRTKTHSDHQFYLSPSLKREEVCTAAGM